MDTLQSDYSLPSLAQTTGRVGGREIRYLTVVALAQSRRISVPMKVDWGEINWLQIEHRLVRPTVSTDRAVRPDTAEHGQVTGQQTHLAALPRAGSPLYRLVRHCSARLRWYGVVVVKCRWVA